MNTNKDYYRILGVLEDAEDIVIKAAYRALAQKYHPDKFQGNAKVAEERMKEINEAYAVLSDAASRKKYDAQRVKAEYEDDASEDTDDLLHTLDKDWADALEYYPDLNRIVLSLTKYSKKLEYTFKTILIERKEFKNRHLLADKLRKDYLEKYFGTNELIQEFATELFNKNRLDILKKLNRAVNLLGANIEAERVIEKINQEYFGSEAEPEKTSEYFAQQLQESLQLDSSLNFQNYSWITVPRAKDFLESIGIKVESPGFLKLLSGHKGYLLKSYNQNMELSEKEMIEFAVKKSQSSSWRE